MRTQQGAKRIALAVLACVLIATSACSSPPPPTIPDEARPPRAGALGCFPPQTMFAQSWFVLADLDLGTSCRVFLEQDECVLGIFHDCTDPSPNSRQWVGLVETIGINDDRLRFQIYEGAGTTLGRAPKCCSGKLMDKDWASLDCRLTACDNTSDKVHVGALIERESMPDPFAIESNREPIDATVALTDLALLPGRQELWAIARDAIVVHTIGGTSLEVGTATDAQRLVASPDEANVYVANGSVLLRIDVAARQIAESINLGAPIDLLALTQRGLAVGTVAGDNTSLTLRRPGNIATVDASATTAKLAALIELPAATDARAFLAAPTRGGGGELLVLSSTLAQSGTGPSLEKPARALYAINTGTVGFLAECSDRSTEKHCFFELDVAANAVRRTGIPDIGAIIDAAYDATNDRIIFSGASGLAVLDRAEWRPLIQRRVAIEGLGPLAIDGTDLYALMVEDGYAEHLLLR